MILRSLDRSSMMRAYDMGLQKLLSSSDVAGMPFGSVFGSVDARSSSKLHAHQDGEMFIVLRGTARVTCGGESRPLHVGDVLYIPPFTTHELSNDTDEAFELVSIFWENARATADALEDHPALSGERGREVVFCPPPTPNGGLHLGHLAGPYVRADMYARARRMAGADVTLVTGTDDHQSYVEVVARTSGQGAGDVARTWGDDILATLADAAVDPDRATRPLRDAGHADRMRELLRQVAESGAVSTRTVETAYCEGCDVSLHQAFARGRCPACDATSDGEICEACGVPGEARDLIDVRCRLCGATAGTRTETAEWLDLQAVAPRLRSYIAGTAGGSDLRALVEALTDGSEPMRPYRLTRSTDWGVGSGASDGEALDAWVELALTFLSTARSIGRDAAEPPQITVFLGYDNSYYYGVLLPALAFACGLEAWLPTTFVTNRFLLLDGEKFSTSRGHAIWARDALEASGTDAVRLAVLRHAPEGRTTSMGAEESRGAEPLLPKLAEWRDGLADTLTATAGLVPQTGAWTAHHREFYRSLQALTDQLLGAVLPGAFSARTYVRGLEGLVERIADFRAVELAVRRTPAMDEEARTGVALELLAAKALTAFLFPVLPATASGVWADLGLPGGPRFERPWTFLPEGHAVPAGPDELGRDLARWAVA